MQEPKAKAQSKPKSSSDSSSDASSTSSSASSSDSESSDLNDGAKPTPSSKVLVLSDYLFAPLIFEPFPFRRRAQDMFVSVLQRPQLLQRSHLLRRPYPVGRFFFFFNAYLLSRNQRCFALLFSSSIGQNKSSRHAGEHISQTIEAASKL